MKKIFLILLLFIGLNLQTLEAQTFNIDENTIIKDIDGKTISIDKFAELLNTGEWMIDQKTDAEGIDYLQLRKSTEEEKEALKKMMNNRGGTSDLIGEKVSNFSLIDMDGNTITSKNTNGKVVVLNFWFIACKPCVSEIPELNKVHEIYKNRKDIVFASITFDTKDKVKVFLKENSISYPVVTDTHDIMDDLNINGYPTNIVIGKDGKIADFITGGFPTIGEHIESVIEAALKAN